MILMKDIVRDGDPILRAKAKEVSIPPSDEDKKILQDMHTYLKNSQDPEIAKKYNLRSGVGLAAPQIGVSKRLISVYFEDSRGKRQSHCLINPKITSHSVEKAYLANGEGCLSVDRVIEGYVIRHARITVEAFNIQGEAVKLRLKDYAAIVFQHEIDHLNGIMFYDYIDEGHPFYTPENAKAIE